MDIGSSSISMDVFEIKDESYNHIRHDSANTFLSSGVARDGLLDEETLLKTSNVLKQFKKTLKAYENVEIFAVCTAAVRQAKNGEEALKIFQKSLGKNASCGIITGEKEAYYDFLGTVNSCNLKDYVICDVGGASTEISLVQNRKLIGSVSLAFGANILTDRHFPQDFVSKHSVLEAETAVKNDIQNIPWLSDAKGLPIIGLGSSMREIARAEMKKRLFSSSPLHNYSLLKANFEFMYKKISKLTEFDRVNKLNIKKALARGILGGLVPFKVLADEISARKLYYSESGLRLGFFYEVYSRLLGKDPIEPDVVASGIKKLQLKYNVDIEHANDVKNIALMIYDSLFETHRLGARYRDILETAAELHDIGEFISYSNHHKHSMYIIEESQIYGEEFIDKFLIALVASGHRRQGFALRFWQKRKLLDKNLFTRIHTLSNILALAEYMVKNYHNRNFSIGINPKEVNINLVHPKTTSPLDLACTTQFYKRILGRRVLII